MADYLEAVVVINAPVEALIASQKLPASTSLEAITIGNASLEAVMEI